MKAHGMTLLEVMIVIAILASVMGVLFTLAQSVGAAAQSQEARVTALDEARRGMQIATRELRQAARRTINWTGAPSSLTYQIVLDADGNGVGVDINGDQELSAQRTIGLDTDDANEDGVTNTQLIITDGNVTRVLANDLVPGTGIQFGQWGNGLQITIRTQRRAGVHGPLMPSELSEIVIPRN